MPTPHAVLTQFRAIRPRHEVTQERTLDWLAAAHAEAQSRLEGSGPEARQALEGRVRKALRRFGCPPEKIAARGFALPDFLSTDWDANAFYDFSRRPRGPGSEERSRRFAEFAAAYFDAAYADEAVAPRDLIHVTCTGYVAPSAAQRLVAARGWGGQTRVTHAYHMGCYAALPAVRIAAGCFATASPSAPAGAGRVDIAHTEFCGLHVRSPAPTAEQLVVQSLFADGTIRYSMRLTDEGPGLRLLATHERVLPDSAGAMSWLVGDAGMQMTLSADVPARVGGALRGFVAELCALAGRDVGALRGAVAAVHPGGPKIIDVVCEQMGLEEEMLAETAAVLRDHGNCSSATVLLVLDRIRRERDLSPGDPVLFMAFGPGLTLYAARLRARRPTP